MELERKTNGKCYGINHKIMVAYPKQKEKEMTSQIITIVKDIVARVYIKSSSSFAYLSSFID